MTTRGLEPTTLCFQSKTLFTELELQMLRSHAFYAFCLNHDEETKYPSKTIWTGPWENVSYISAFVVRCLDSVMSLVSVIKAASLMLASVAKQTSLSLT